MELDRCVSGLLLAAAILCCSAAGRAEGQEQEEASAAVGDYGREEWLPAPPTLDWSPRHNDHPPATERPVRRRRIRKRKRRPPPPFDPDHQDAPPRRSRPNRWEEGPELWDEMEDESPKRAIIRRRPNPRHPSEERVKVRDPFTALEEEEAKRARVESTTVPLVVKEVLKETTGRKVSLSELLQKKNISLAELLKGDPLVLSALTETSDENNAVSPNATESINRNFEAGSESTEALEKSPNLHAMRTQEIVTNRMSLKPAKNETEGPTRITIDLESALDKQQDEEIPHKLEKATAKEELMDILKDPVGRERLAKILELRNMTLEELIAQRERGSSNLHLADIFHSETREPEPPEKAHVGKISVLPTVKVIPLNAPRGRSLEFPSYTVTSFPTYKIGTEKPEPARFFPVWRDVLHEGGGEVPAANYSTDFAGAEDEDDLARIEDVENKIAESVGEKLNVDVVVEETAEAGAHSGVKSAILASALIVGASMSVFLTIFVVFKWTQKQKTRLNYCDSFSRILEVDHKRSIRTIMTETLGRRRSPYYKQNLQAMSDISWESDRKPYQ